MWDDSFVQFLIVIALIAFAIAFESSYVKKAKEKIEELLNRSGFQDIEMSRVWEFGRRDLAFDVKYRNIQGEMIVNSCVVASGFFSPGDIYWKNPI